MNINFIKSGEIALIMPTEDGRISQLAMTVEQSNMLQILVASISKSNSFVQMGEDYDLILKSKHEELRNKYVAELAKKDVENKKLKNQLKALEAKVLQWSNETQDVSFKTFFDIKKLRP